MASEDQAAAPRFRMGWLGVAWRAGFLLVAYGVLIWVAYFAGGRAAGANTAERIGYAVGVALIPLGGRLPPTLLIIATRRRAARAPDVLVSLLAMVALAVFYRSGPKLLGRARWRRNRQSGAAERPDSLPG